MTDIRKMSKRELEDVNARMAHWRERNKAAQDQEEAQAIPILNPDPVQMDLPI